MPVAPPTKAELDQAKAAVERHGNVAEAARHLNMPRTTLRDWLEYDRTQPSRWLNKIKGRRHVDVPDDCTILVASDGHYWPGPAYTAHRAFVRFCKRAKPALVVYSGDVLDAPTISRHPPIGWDKCPTLADELEVCEERLNEIVQASGKAKRYWPLGNHDSRFETKMATAAPEFRGVHGLSLADRFPLWEPCWSLFVNDIIVIKHRLKGGMHAGMNNTLWSGMHTVTSHTHRLTVRAHSDYRGTRYGIETGTLSDPYAPAFQDYTEDAPKAWQAGFIVLTLKGGRLMWPEVVAVVDESAGLVQYRSELIEV